MKITSDFPGGNIKVLSIEDKIVRLEQDLKGTADWWFYWCFRVDNPDEGTFEFTFQNGEVVSAHGPAVSTDGVSWTRRKDCFLSHTRFSYTFTGQEPFVYFSFAYPYTLSNFDRFCSSIVLQKHFLCKSEDGREIPYLTFGNGSQNAFIIARHHCCETPASFVLEGIVSAALQTPSLLKLFTFHVFPFADLDGTEKGEQGKGRAPHDHNRDYIDEPLYAFTKAIKVYAREHTPSVYLDLHAPLKWGGTSDATHLHISESGACRPDAQDLFVAKLSANAANAVIGYEGVTIPFYPEKTVSSKYFFAVDCKATLAVTIETPYSGNREFGYDVAALYEWGENIAKTLADICTTDLFSNAGN